MSSIKYYIAIARPDHWVKHIFVLPGTVLAVVLLDVEVRLINVLLGFLAAGLVASANYVINEWLDAEFDKYHPVKKYRPTASGEIKPLWVYVEYCALMLLGLVGAWFINRLFFVTMLVFLFSGLVYNVQPFRFKDRVWVDVLVESFNNPIRVVLGWSMVSANTLPPSSLMIAYWFSAAFLMSAKRLGEFRFLKQHNFEEIGLYRRSFLYYTEERLAVASLLYAIIASFFLGVFLIKYRYEFLFLIPPIAFLFSYYFFMALAEKSIVQTPEKLHKDKVLMAITIAIIGLSAVLSLVDIKAAHVLAGSGIMPLGEISDLLSH